MLSRISKDKVLNQSASVPIEEPTKLENSFRKKRSLFYEESDSEGYKPFRITLRKTTQMRRSYLPNPQRK